MKRYIIGCLLSLTVLSCKDKCKDESCLKSNAESTTSTMEAKNTDQEIGCKLTSEEMRKRKETVIASLKSQILEKKELKDGYSFKFEGTDKVVDELTEFVKSERSCCSFFIFTISFSGDGKEAWLTLTGPDGAKEMISDEIGL